MHISNEMLKVLLSSDREKAFEVLYEQAFPPVARFISRMGGDFNDAKDIFQDALIVFYEKVVGENIVIKVTAQAYVLGIAKHLWSRKFRGQQSCISLDDVEKNIQIPDDFYAPPPTRNRLLKYLEMAGKKCMDMLQGFYYRNMSMQEITDAFDYGSVRSATVQKYKCLEKIRQHVKASDHEEIFA
jgi:DNA-directed RNA polymerase specialized sigma24 family protein